MKQQHEITTSAPLLGKDGDLLEPGWARSLLPVYRRADIKASPMRITMPCSLARMKETARATRICAVRTASAKPFD